MGEAAQIRPRTQSNVRASTRMFEAKAHDGKGQFQSSTLDKVAKAPNRRKMQQSTKHSAMAGVNAHISQQLASQPMSGMKSQNREAASRKVVERVQNSGDQALAMAMASRAIAEEQQANGTVTQRIGSENEKP